MKSKIIAFTLFGVGMCYLSYTGYTMMKPTPQVSQASISAVDEIYAISNAVIQAAQKAPDDLKQNDIGTTLVRVGHIPDKYIRDGLIIDSRGDPIQFTYESAINAIRVNYTIESPQECVMAAHTAMTVPGYIPYLQSTGIKSIPDLMQETKNTCSKPGEKTLNFVWSLSPPK